MVELNQIAQSTDLQKITAGSIQDRFKAFGIETKYISSTNVFELIELAVGIIKDVKENCKPMAVIVEADRLCAHSKGDDDRPKEKIRFDLDPVLILKNKLNNFDSLHKEAHGFIIKLMNN